MDNTINTINTNSYTQNYTNYCSYRLPCGVCLKTNSICPLSGGICTPTWEVTCTTTTGAVGTDEYRDATSTTHGTLKDVRAIHTESQNV